MKAFARGCMRTYLILKEKAERWNADPEIQALVARITEADDGVDGRRSSARTRRSGRQRSASSSSTAGPSARAASPTSSWTS